MEKQLEKLHNFLENRHQNYISMVAIGSIAVGDKWIENRSDNDILLIFEEIPNSLTNELESYLKTSSFDETFFFTPITKEIFQNSNNSSHDFSNKFRSKTLFGIDLIENVKLPTKEQSQVMSEKGISAIVRRIKSRIANSPIWEEERVKKEFWKLFKHTFMYLAIKHYVKTQNYPKTRLEVVETNNSDILSEVLNTLNEINEKSKEEIIIVGKRLLESLEKL